MLKAPLMASLFASLLMGVSIASNTNATSRPERNKNIIVEVDRDNDTLTEEGIKNTQDRVIANIKAYATTNIEVSTRFQNIANAFVLSVNEDDIEAIKKVPGVKSVTLDQIHWVTAIADEVADEGVVELKDEEEGSSEYGGNDNVSAETMEKPEDTFDGEGTAVAILDNEFFFRAPRVTGASDDDPHHETFSAFTQEEDVALKYNGRPANYKSTHAYKNATSSSVATDNPGLVIKDETGKTVSPDSIELGKEGSFYYNNKVPFYFDYGGEKEFYGDTYHEDWDVSSRVTYHGSHVASITAGHAETYKGIAPKAQLICMKVFTVYKATPFETGLGFSSHSGASDIPILTALEDCITLGVDGINMSLGSNLDDFDSGSITLKVLSELAQKGILTSISAGNSGKTSYQSLGAYANWTKDMSETGILSSYANNADVMTIAAGQPDRIFYKNAFKLKMGEETATVEFDDQIVNREGYDKDYQKEYKMVDLLEGDMSKSLDWVYVKGFGTEADYVESLDYYDGKVIVVNRGSTSFSDKYSVARSKNAKALVVINNDPTQSDFNFRMSFGDGFRPTMPCALVLFKDKGIFEGGERGSFNIIQDQVDENAFARTISTFSSDGATYDLDLKPEITAPGENIRGAVPPQKEEDSEQRPNSTYEFLSGTSMSAPNYAGAQALLTSKVAGPLYKQAKAAGRELTAAENKEIEDYRKTVDMRYMSTAKPMLDVNENPEDGKVSLTSPRRQGAGMANIGKAYNTDVYLEGLNDKGDAGIGKSKINLRNNADIQKGKISISFIGHNESQQTKNYKVQLVVMRPAIAATTDIITKDYNNQGEVSEINKFPGFTYWKVDGVGAQARNKQYTSDGTFANKDVFEVTRDIEYYATEADLIAQKATVIAKGKYYNAGDDKVADWKPLPTYNYQSPLDKEIARVDLQTLAITPGDNSYQLNAYEIDDDAKAEIAAFFEYGTYLEGYVMFEATDENGVDLSMPFMGYYMDYSNAPVFEPFNFEKNVATVYPSDLANNVAKTLIGKDFADMQSMMVAGYLEPGTQLDTEEILYNNDNFANLTGFYPLGTDAATGEYLPDASKNLYLGGPDTTNTLIIQQFVLRSVRDNWFTIKNKKTGEQVYRGNLEDSLYGDYWETNNLYKSHVDDSYLGSGVIAHRGWAIVPLYDVETGEPFKSGDYTIEFNYKLAGLDNKQTITKSYTLHIDSDRPLVKSIDVTSDTFTITVTESALASAVVGKYVKEFTPAGKGTYSVSFPREELQTHLDENMNTQQGSGRLYIGLTDQARNKIGALVRFKENLQEGTNKTNVEFKLIQHKDLTLTHDFRYRGEQLIVEKYDAKKNKYNAVELEGIIALLDGNYVVTATEKTRDVVVNVCGGNIGATSIVLSLTAGIALVLVIAGTRKRKKQEGGNF